MVIWFEEEVRPKHFKPRSTASWAACSAVSKVIFNVGRVLTAPLIRYAAVTLKEEVFFTDLANNVVCGLARYPAVHTANKKRFSSRVLWNRWPICLQ